MAEEVIQSITWEAPEHRHIEKNVDWFWVVGLLSIAAAAAAFIFGNVLFGLVIIFGAVAMVLHALREPAVISFALTARGVRVDEDLFPYTTFSSYHIDENGASGPQLLLEHTRTLQPMLIIPIPEEYLEEIEDMVGARIPEGHLEEPFSHQLLEFLGF